MFHAETQCGKDSICGELPERAAGRTRGHRVKSLRGVVTTHGTVLSKQQLENGVLLGDSFLSIFAYRIREDQSLSSTDATLRQVADQAIEAGALSN